MTYRIIPVEPFDYIVIGGTGDLIRLDAQAGRIEALVDADDWASRSPAAADLSENAFGMGREMFAMFRAHASSGDTGACIFSEGA